MCELEQTGPATFPQTAGQAGTPGNEGNGRAPALRVTPAVRARRWKEAWRSRAGERAAGIPAARSGRGGVLVWGCPWTRGKTALAEGTMSEAKKQPSRMVGPHDR